MAHLHKIQFKNPDAVSVLRIGLALVFLYASTQMFANPSDWIGFVPSWVGAILPIETFLWIHAIFELLLGLMLLVGLWLHIGSFLAFIDFLSILIFYGIDVVTFRDFGLLMASLALFLLVARPEKK